MNVGLKVNNVYTSIAAGISTTSVTYRVAHTLKNAATVELIVEKNVTDAEACNQIATKTIQIEDWANHPITISGPVSDKPILLCNSHNFEWTGAVISETRLDVCVAQGQCVAVTQRLNCFTTALYTRLNDIFDVDFDLPREN